MKNFAAILTDLRAAIAARAARDLALTAVLVLVWGRLSRAAMRLERLYGLWLAGKVSVARKSGGRKGVQNVVLRPRIPRGRGWLAVRVWETRAFGLQLQHLLNDPGFTTFLAAVPRAARVVRPVFRMLMVDTLPEVLCEQAAVVAGPRKDRRRAVPASVRPRKGVPQLPKGAWFAPPGPNWGSGG